MQCYAAHCVVLQPICNATDTLLFGYIISLLYANDITVNYCCYRVLLEDSNNTVAKEKERAPEKLIITFLNRPSIRSINHQLTNICTEILPVTGGVILNSITTICFLTITDQNHNKHMYNHKYDKRVRLDKLDQSILGTRKSIYYIIWVMSALIFLFPLILTTNKRSSNCDI